MSDESLREFQLNGKQLVFLFMASTVVAVVIFLCGVMVGRGVSAAQLAGVPNSTVDTGDPTAGVTPEPVVSAPLEAPADVAPDSPGDDPTLTYAEALTAANPKADLDTPKLSGGSKASASTAKVAPVATRSAPTTTTISAAKTSPPAPALVPGKTPSSPESAAATGQLAGGEPAGNGFVVQVAATPRREEADVIRGRLAQKGYPAFVTSAGPVFRVRVGKYKDRAEANVVAKRLETEERFKPWVTR